MVFSCGPIFPWFESSALLGHIPCSLLIIGFSLGPCSFGIQLMLSVAYLPMSLWPLLSPVLESFGVASLVVPTFGFCPTPVGG